MGMDNYSLSDIKAVTNDDDFGGGSWFWIVVLFLFMFGSNGGGFFGGNGALTRAEMTEGFNNQSVLNKLDGISNGLCDGFYAQNTTMLQGFNGLGNQIAQCCCDTNRNIDAVRYEASKNTCDITTAIHAEGEQTRALINANTMQALRDKLALRFVWHSDFFRYFNAAARCDTNDLALACLHHQRAVFGVHAEHLHALKSTVLKAPLGLNTAKRKTMCVCINKLLR